MFLADFLHDNMSQQDTFLLSNSVPQYVAFAGKQGKLIFIALPIRSETIENVCDFDFVFSIKELERYPQGSLYSLKSMKISQT